MARVLALNIVNLMLWLFAVGAGIVLVSRFETRIAAAKASTSKWPAEAPVALEPQRDTLVMFVHPHCPCSRASLHELDRLLARCPGQVSAHVFFFSPAQYPGKWTLTALWRNASAIAGVSVHLDSDGIIASQVGADTSGYVLLFNPRGEVLFRGGITAAPGQPGDNAGEDALLALIQSRKSGVTETPVYGCCLAPESSTTRAVASR